MSDALEDTPIELPGALRHPSGWWKARDGKWYRPEQQPAAESAEKTDLVTALSIAVGAVMVGSLLGTGHEWTLLIGGTAGALVARWWVFSRDVKGLLTSAAVLSAGATALLLDDVARVAQAAGHPGGGVLVATAGAFMATALALALRRVPAVD